MARSRVMSCMLSLLLAILLLAPARAASSNCLCQVSGCLCCVELNLTSSIDLGGPACVNVRQRDQNVSLNLSYGDNPVHNATIRLDEAANKPTCMNLLSDLAQICAQFVSMKVPIMEGQRTYNGCLVIEPAFLGTAQATYSVGCFNFDSGRVQQIEGPVLYPLQGKQGQKPDIEEQEDEEEDGLNAEELIAAVSASAQQGIVLFSQWLGLNLTPKLNITGSTNNITDEALQQPSSMNTNRSGRHGRNMALQFETEDKSDEKFKQLLIAQDNILKESATIGVPSNGLATNFFYSHPSTEEMKAPNQEVIAVISPENLAVVSSESRRGGRAYSIHQHANEV